MQTLKIRTSLALALMLPGLAAAAELQVKRVTLPDMDPVKLKPYAQLEPNANREPSGLVKSRTHANLYWTINDSGDGPRLYPHDRYGKIIGGHTEGVMVLNAHNLDWEAMTIDDKGNLIVGDVGNNSQARRDLSFYWIAEPNPVRRHTLALKQVFFTYPDYPDPADLPAKLENFDCEGIFHANGKVYLVTKNRSDSHTSLYRLDSQEPFTVNTLTLLDRFDIGGLTTAAEASDDGRRLVITTYSAIWLFEVAAGRDNFFDGRISWLPIDTWRMGERMQYGQNEAVCFDGDSLILSSGEGFGDLYEVPVSDLIVVKE